MPTNYPGGLDNWTNPSSTTAMDAAGFEHDLVHSNVFDAIEAVEAELGTDPSDTFATVTARLDLLMRAAGQVAPSVGRWRGVLNSPVTPTGAGPILSTLYAAPMWLPESLSFDRIGINVTTAATASTARLGVYSSNATTRLPDALLFDAGTVATATTGLKEITIAQTFGPGIFWLAFISASAIAVSYFPLTSAPRIAGGGITQSAPVQAVVVATDPGTYALTGLPNPHPASETFVEDYFPNGPHVSLREV